MSRKVAFITGASRGIGRAIALELADAGFDIAITARTVADGERREHSSTLEASDTTALPGSLTTTASMIEKRGVDALVVPADLLDMASLGAAVATVLERKGRVDVVVHNGRYIGPGHMDRFIDTPIELLRKQMDANVFAPLTINQLVIPAMIAQGGGIIINITSAACYGDPKKAAGEGGWGMGYGITKGAFQRIAGFLNLELGTKGIRCFNVQPGHVTTERMVQDMAKFGFDAGGAPMEVPAKAVRWLCTDPDADAFTGQSLEAQFFVHERGLLPGWAGPKRDEKDQIKFDLSSYILKELNEG